jgi:RNA polymerase sigma factor (sigma-70 family)
MATNRLEKALDHLRAAVAPPETDAQLLARFLACRDEAAFTALVRRHGPLVLGVCRRVLRHAQDAEDAFQAAFLVLARKAGSVLKGAAVGSWLYMVAYRTAQRARARQARRQAREKQVDEIPHPQVEPQQVEDWRPLLDQELSRLPEKYRTPVVLCDLQGQSRREAARQLRLPDGTLSRRLVAGRRLLAERLSRRGKRAVWAAPIRVAHRADSRIMAFASFRFLHPWAKLCTTKTDCPPRTRNTREALPGCSVWPDADVLDACRAQ